MIQSLTITSPKEACLWGLVFFQGLGVFRFAQEENPASAGKMALFYGKKRAEQVLYGCSALVCGAK